MTIILTKKEPGGKKAAFTKSKDKAAASLAAQQEKFKGHNPVEITIYLQRNLCQHCSSTIISGTPSQPLIKYEKEAPKFRAYGGKLQSGGTESWSRPIEPALMPSGVPINRVITEVKTKCCPFCIGDLTS